jgi:hypothetical protein
MSIDGHGDLSLHYCSTPCQLRLGDFQMRVVEQNQRNPYECSSSHSKVVACASYIQRAELQGCRVAS